MSLRSFGSVAVFLLLAPACVIKANEPATVPAADTGVPTTVDAFETSPTPSVTAPAVEAGVPPTPSTPLPGADAAPEIPVQAATDAMPSPPVEVGAVDATPTGLPIVEVPCKTITEETTWKPAVYRIDNKCRLIVSAALTILPGSVVKLSSGSHMLVWGGTLSAMGTATNPIVFTSLADDTHGGDTNGDGSKSQPQKGDWGSSDSSDPGGILFNSTGSRLDYVQVLYASDGITIHGESNRITNSVFAHNLKHGIIIGNNFSDTGHPTIASNALYDNDDYPIRADAWVNIEGNNVFHDPANPAVMNGKQCIDMREATATQKASLGVTEVGFYLASGTTFKSEMTLAPGVIFKPQLGASIRLEPDAAKLINGRQAIFTSSKDDAVGGDCTGDGATPPSEGDWKELFVQPADGTTYAASSANIRFASDHTTPPQDIP